MQTPQMITTGVEVDGYRIEEVLGRGGMGIVYKAEEINLSRPVALKVINPDLARDDAFVRRFRSEARALARINSSHIVHIHALRRTEAGMFIVMEYVEGGTLADRIREGALSWSEAYPLIRQMLDALEQAHSVGVIHRDIKPGNIMLSKAGRVKVTDFGLAKVHEGNRASTVTQGVAGTLYYMSPEQVKGLHSLDHRSDIYSLAMTFYEMLTGRLPFDREESDFAIMRQIVESEYAAPAALEAAVPESVSRVIMRALRKDPDDRYGSAREMLEALEHAGPDMPAAPAARPGGTKSIWIGGALLALVLLGGMAYLFLGGEPRAASQPAGPAEEVAESEPQENTALQPYMLDGEVLARPSVEDLPEEDPESSTDRQEESRPVAPARTSSEEETAVQEPAPREADLVPARVTLSAADPGVRVTVDGETQGAPARFTLPPGSYDVTMSHPEYGERRERLVVREGERREMTYHFTGSVSIASPVLEDGSAGPWAKIWVDGASRDNWFTPKEIVLPPGTHTVSLSKQGYLITNNDQRVEIEPGFEPIEHSLTFQMRPL